MSPQGDFVVQAVEQRLEAGESAERPEEPAPREVAEHLADGPPARVSRAVGRHELHRSRERRLGDGRQVRDFGSTGHGQGDDPAGDVPAPDPCGPAPAVLAGPVVEEHRAGQHVRTWAASQRTGNRRATPSATPARTCRIAWSELRARGSKLRLVSSTTKRSRAGSIQISVPVQPVWPYAAPLSSEPNDEGCSAAGSGVSQPSRRVPAPGSGARNRCMVARLTQGWPFGSLPPRSQTCAKRARSRPVEKSPAWPATPPKRSAFRSLGSPTSGAPSSEVLGAIRDQRLRGGVNMV